MFFERLGRALFSKISPIVFCCSLTLPPLATAAALLHCWNSDAETQEQLLSRLRGSEDALLRKQRMDLFWTRYARPAPYFLDKELESLVFLRKEQEALHAWKTHPTVSDKAELCQRLAFLDSEENRLVFSEEGVQKSPVCKETIEVQRHPVEMNGDDLVSVLRIIENLDGQNERPQLIVSELRLSRKTTVLQSQPFEVQMRLLKREFL